MVVTEGDVLGVFRVDEAMTGAASPLRTFPAASQQLDLLVGVPIQCCLLHDLFTTLGLARLLLHTINVSSTYGSQFNYLHLLLCMPSVTTSVAAIT